MELRDKDGLTEKEYLDQYCPSDYVRPSIAADMVIFTVNKIKKDNYRKLPTNVFQILLIKRGCHPFMNTYALPGGFVRQNETVGDAAARELKEETGVEHVYLEQLFTFSDPNRDPRMWVISCAHIALVDSSHLTINAGDDADSAAWFQVSYKLLREQKDLLVEGVHMTNRYELVLMNEHTKLSAVVEHTILSSDEILSNEYVILENQGLAFDHAKIIAYAIEHLRNKIEHTSIALHLMPKYFTLTELQQVYEVILDKELLKAAFRRKIANLVLETDRYTENAGHRPSRLYCRNPKFS